MAMVLKPKNKSVAVVVPEGSYKATLSKVTQFANAYGERIGFEFSLHGEGVEGAAVMRSTNPILTAKSKLAEVLNGLLGRELTHDEINKGVDVEQMIGTECNVLVLNNKSKTGATYSNVERIFK
jgi:hypothetical protein